LVVITYDISPEGYRHWVLTVDPPIATLALGGEGESGDDGRHGTDDAEGQLASLLRVDIELSDAVQRLRFEYPDIGAVVVTGATNQAFSTQFGEIPPGASPDVAAEVWTFRNEVRCAIEDASANSGQHWLAALNGPASGPGYELALATDEIVLVDDGRSSVALPDGSAAGALPPTGGLARLVDKRHVRPDLIDALCSCPGGVSGDRAADWGLVDITAPQHCFTETVGDRALKLCRAAGTGQRGPASEAVQLAPLLREEFEGGFAYPNVRVDVDREAAAATLTIVGPAEHECFAPEPGPRRLRSRWWPLAVCRELDDALLLLRSSCRPEVRSLVLRTEGDPLAVAAADVAMTSGYEHDWFVREVVLFWKRTLKRVDAAWQSVIALVEPGSCFVGTLLELALAADRTYMVDETAPDDPEGRSAGLLLTGMNFGPLPRASGLTRLGSRFLTRSDHVAALAQRVGDPITATEAVRQGLVTEVVPPAEWESRTRRAIEERAGLTNACRAGLAVALGGAGPETLETKIFSRRPLR
jgi:benzoyl-CoA-dihydrodiol lyase